MTNEQVDAIMSAKTRYESAVRSKLGLKTAKEQLKTVMFNCYPDLVTMLKSDGAVSAVNADELAALKSRVVSLEADIESLQGSLQEMDDENAALRKELKAAQSKRKAVDANAGT